MSDIFIDFIRDHWINLELLFVAIFILIFIIFRNLRKKTKLLERPTKNKEEIAFLIWGISLIIISIFYISNEIYYENTMVFFNPQNTFLLSLSFILGIKLTFRSINYKEHTYISKVIFSSIVLIYMTGFILFVLTTFPEDDASVGLSICFIIYLEVWGLVWIEVILNIANKYPLVLEIFFNSVYTIFFISMGYLIIST